tara:strand:- start:2538 stop:2759 length:222 start_codon:yes stop_codon:yes gene_type:complete
MSTADQKLSVADQSITRHFHNKLPTGDYSKAVWKLAQYHKKICMENLYTWKTMDCDLLEEAAKIIKGNNVPSK